MKILLVVYDNDSYVHWFPQGLGYIAAVLEREGYEVEIYSQDLHHYPEEHLTEYLNKNHFDFIAISVIAGYYQYGRLLKLSKAINKSQNRPYYLLGGHGPAPEPDYFLKKTGADAIVIGEGEETVLELLEAVINKKPLSKISGIAYQDGRETVVTPERPLIPEKDLDGIPFPAYHMFPIEYYRLIRHPRADSNDFVMPVLSGRGCTFKCNFCFRMDKGFRGRSSEGIIEEIKLLKKNYGVSYVVFSDELLMMSKERTLGLAEAILKANLNIKWNCNGRLNYATPEVLDVMKRSGCVFINYGIESMDNEVLKTMKKGLRTDQVYKGIEETLKAGISPGFNIIFGHIGDTLETLEKSVEFLLKYDDGSQLRNIRPVTPYPGSPLYYTAIERGLLKDREEFYEKKHSNSDLVAVNFTELTDEEFHKALLKANTRLVKNYFDNKCQSMVKVTENFYLNADVSFRGFRHT